MKLESCNRANSAYRGRVEREKFLENRIDRGKTFEKRVELAKEKADLIIDSPNYRKIADDLLDRMSIEEIKNMNEEKLSQESGDYDPAVLLALCVRLDEDKNKSEEN